MEILEVLVKRKSYRSFDKQLLNKSEIDLLFETARIAPSSSNAQAWKYFYAVRGTEAFDKVLNSLAVGNQGWAKNAALLIVSTAAKENDNGSKYIHAWHDVGLANSQLILQATHMGYFGHMMGGFSTEKAIKAISLPESHEPVCVIAVGKQGDGSDLSDELKFRENQDRVRKPIEEVVQEIS
ncbi:MAG: nitroreductase family protein [Bacteroidia bacterium]